ncbi:MAG: hypothetical protein JRE28_11665 [Deltaproteobacteria bacterium]|nr:hypothetical protein [Deltaproteobacteria bacterium]
MKHDPFGNLNDWEPVIDLFDELAEKGKLAECQPGLVRILRYKGNWRLREEVLKRIGKFQAPSDELMSQVITILDDDNIYYDARTLACEALIQLSRNVQDGLYDKIITAVRKVVEKLINSPQPLFFDKKLKTLYSQIGLPGTMEN